jgi:hypothetical protein
MGKNVRNKTGEGQDIETVRGVVQVPPDGIAEVSPRTAARVTRTASWDDAPVNTPDEEKTWPVGES